MGAHNPHACDHSEVRDLCKIIEQAKPKDDHTILGEPMKCLRPGCRQVASAICTVSYCSEHHVETCHKLMSPLKTLLEDEAKRGTATESSQSRIACRTRKHRQRPNN